jgi:cephalosporin hydroxylase
MAPTLRERLNPARHPRTVPSADTRPSYHSTGEESERISAHPLVRTALTVYRRTAGRLVNVLFHMDLMAKTKNFDDVTWLGSPVWQNVLDLWTTQEALAEVRPKLLIECGTNRGGSALFYASMFDLMGDGEVVTIDLERMHDHEHPRVTWLIGSSTDPAIVEQVAERARAAAGPVMVILDSDHSKAHVAAELEAYAPLVTPNSLLLVQDGVIDTMPTGRPYRPGPLPAIHEFLAVHPEFQPDERLNGRFLITHHPQGWLRKR